MRNDFKEGAFLAHSAKGTSWKSTKYLKKVQLGNGRYYYIYTQAQLNAWNKRNSSGSGSNKGTPTNVLSNNERNKRITTAVNNGKSLDNIIRNGMVAKGNTLAEKTANLKKNIADGEAAIKKALSSSEASSSKKKGSSGSGSGGSSKKSKGGSGKSSSSKSSKGKSGSSKEKKGSGKTPKEKTTKKKGLIDDIEEKNTPITIDALKKAHGKETTTFKGTSNEFKKSLLEKYEDGAFGYLSAGNKVYKFTIQNGDVILKDYNSDKEISFDKYLKDVKDFKEFKVSTKKK